ncbi:hypothetical protein P9112_007935 [Eukaryota sp. TZLM1-RC]
MKIFFCCFVLLVTISASPISDLYETAKSSLESNIVEMKSGSSYVRAGSHVFGGLWTRDFAFCVPALLKLGHTQTVKEHLEIILSNIRSKDNLVARLFDHIPLAERYALSPLHIFPTVKEPLKSYYVGGNGGEKAIDGNALVVISTLQYVLNTNDSTFLLRHRASLESAMRFYIPHLQEGLVTQPEYSDWADNAKRPGKTFLTNLFVWKALELGKSFELFKNFPISHVQMAGLIKSTFVQNSLIYSVENFNFVGMDNYFFSYFFNFFTNLEQSTLYATLSSHGLWNCSEGTASIPGCASFPPYPKNWISSATKAIGLRHYSDNLYHSFSIAWASYVALKAGDKTMAYNILTEMNRVVRRDGVVHEVFHDNKELKVFNAIVFKSEHPFSWGSATLLLALLEFGV